MRPCKMVIAVFLLYKAQYPFALWCTTISLWILDPNFLQHPCSRKIWRGMKFGGLAVCSSNCQIKIHQNFLLA